MKDKAIKFLKIYLIFLLFVLAVNLSMEILIPTPEREKIIAEHGWASFVLSKVTGLVIFYMIFSFVGSIIFLFKFYKPIIMGILSLVTGFVLEFAFMKPEWVQNIYALQVGGDDIVAAIASVLYWFVPWGIPSYIIHKYIIKSGAHAED